MVVSIMVGSAWPVSALPTSLVGSNGLGLRLPTMVRFRMETMTYLIRSNGRKEGRNILLEVVAFRIDY